MSKPSKAPADGPPDQAGVKSAGPRDGTPAQAPLSRRRRRFRRLLRVLLVAFPFLTLGGAEWVCRLRGHGGYPPVILNVGNDGKRQWYSTYRPGVDTYFYTRLSHTGGVRELHFTTPKPAGTVRIVMLGGSAMQGYPQPKALTNGAFLEAMLNDVWAGERTAQVLNLGATAMASFPAVRFLDDMLGHDPDLVVVMSGNNEFYGAYGVASLHTAGTSPTGMRFMRWMRGLGLKQWLDDLLIKPPSDEKILKQTLMERVAVNQRVPADDPLRDAAEASLRAHLSQIVARCRQRGVPVILCTIPTNERGMAPIGVDDVASIARPKRGRFIELLGALDDAAGAAEAASLLQDAVAVHADHARARFLLARALSSLGRHEEALAHYVAARDLDTMPWRATTAADGAVRQAARDGAILCDMVAAFRDESRNGVIGWELMDDHVHMSLRGQAMFARTVARAMTELTGPARVEPARLDTLPDWRTYAERLGAGVYTDYVAAKRMKTLFEIPFMARANPEALRRCMSRCDELLEGMSEADRKAVDHWRDPGLHVTRNRPITFVVGYYRMADGDYEAAARLFRAARMSVADVSLWRLQLTWYLLKCNRRLHAEPTAEDRRLCREAIEVGELLNRFAGFRDPQAPSYLGRVYNLVGNHQAAVAHLDDAVRYAKGWEGWDVVRALADSLINLGQVDRARLLLNLATKDPDMIDPARRMLAEIDERHPASAPAP